MSKKKEKIQAVRDDLASIARKLEVKPDTSELKEIQKRQAEKQAEFRQLITRKTELEGHLAQIETDQRHANRKLEAIQDEYVHCAFRFT
jgi:hypothetical protein